MLDWFVNPDHVPLYAVDVGAELVVPTDPDEPLRAVAEGRVDLALNYQPNVTLARARGARVRAVGLLIDAVLDTLMVRADGPVLTVTDLAGRRVAFAVEPFDRVMFQAMARHAGLAEGAWRFVDVGFDFTRALVDGRVDAVMGAFRNYEVIEAAELGVPVRIFELADHGVPPFYQLVFVARDDLSPERRAAVALTLARVAAGIAATRRDPDRAFAAFVRAHPDQDDPFHRRAFAATVPAFAASQRQDASRWSTFAAFLRTRGLLDRTPDASELFTNELAA
ncbi:MAG TPA: ABC transporter substrate-binding protein [Candidatus Limnocylindria bacterium]|nr:ABC transporter substrate-binding protein [Candidatus Limnocylindria bacterium]